MNVRFVECRAEDAELLSALGAETFSDTFAALNTAETMAAYLAAAFHPDTLRAEIRSPHSVFLFLYLGDELAGYLKVSEEEAQSDLKEEGGLEVARIYVRRAFQGRGLGRVLMEKALEIAGEKGKGFVWLGVWERNEKAIGFYERMGFRKTGTHAFQMGDERQTDFIMRKETGGRGPR